MRQLERPPLMAEGGEEQSVTDPSIMMSSLAHGRVVGHTPAACALGRNRTCGSAE